MMFFQDLWATFFAAAFTAVSSFVSSGFTWIRGFFGPKET